MRTRVAVAVVLLAGTLAHAQGASSVTERGRKLESILELALFPASDPPRAVMLVIDPTPSLRTADFAEKLAGALKKQAENLRLGVAILGEKSKPLVPGSDRKAVVERVRAALKKPALEVRDVYTPLKKIVARFATGSGRKEIVLVTLENGDTEFNLDASVAAMKSANVPVTVVAREAFLSDSYWISGAASAVQAPRGAELAGADGAFVDVPWGWLFQFSRITEVAPAGHAMYGLGRLAYATGGRVHIYYPQAGKHKCTLHSTCPFCPGDHMPPFERFRAARLKAVEPSLAPRKQVLKAAAADPFYRAVLRAWSDASKAGLLRSAPAVKPSGSTLVIDKKRHMANVPRWEGRSHKRWATQATKLAGTADRIAKKLREETKKAEAKGGIDRYRAVAELTYVMLRVTRLNLLYCAAYAREIAPVQLDKKRKQPLPPEHAIVTADYRVTGMGYANLSLCHGAAPFARLHLPGGARTKQELAALDEDIKRFHRRNAHTPFAVALGRMGLARFHPTGIGKRTKPVPRDVSGSESGNASTRPERTGGGSSGGSSGPTSGG
ncbi:MAG: vWA domain-containing protein [Planctomycetota bacterium]|jgi:hypothetical protein